MNYFALGAGPSHAEPAGGAAAPVAVQTSAPAVSSFLPPQVAQQIRAAQQRAALAGQAPAAWAIGARVQAVSLRSAPRMTAAITSGQAWRCSTSEMGCTPCSHRRPCTGREAAQVPSFFAEVRLCNPTHPTHHRPKVLGSHQAGCIGAQVWSGDGEWYSSSIIGVSAAGNFIVSFDEDGGTEEVRRHTTANLSSRIMLKAAGWHFIMSFDEGIGAKEQKSHAWCSNVVLPARYQWENARRCGGFHVLGVCILRPLMLRLDNQSSTCMFLNPAIAGGPVCGAAGAGGGHALQGGGGAIAQQGAGGACRHRGSQGARCRVV